MQDQAVAARFVPGCAVLALQQDFSRFAAHLRKWDPALQDDLVQEMSLGVLQCEGEHTLSFFRSRGLSRARDYLRAWQRRSMLDLNQVKTVPVDRSCMDATAIETMLEKVSGLVGINLEELKEEMTFVRTCA